MKRRCVAGLLVLTLAACGSGENPAAPRTGPSTSGAPQAQATPAIVAAAGAFLDSLSAAERQRVLFKRADKAQKQRWSDLPEGQYPRAGLMIANLSKAKFDGFLAMMRATLSDEGYNRILAAWAADDAMTGAGAGTGAGKYGRRYFWVAIIGEPTASQPWQWQFGGHHVTVNATISGDDLSLTPSFLGVEPATYTDGGRPVRPLGDIADRAYALVNSLDDNDRSRAILGAEPIDLVLGAGQDCRSVPVEGLSGGDMSTDQRATLLSLISAYGGLANAEDAAARMARLESDLAQTSFAWYGPVTQSGSAYFRVSGPRVVIEYAPQSGDPAGHIHGIYRDPTFDYGGTVCP